MIVHRESGSTSLMYVVITLPLDNHEVEIVRVRVRQGTLLSGTGPSVVGLLEQWVVLVQRAFSYAPAYDTGGAVVRGRVRNEEYERAVRHH